MGLNRVVFSVDIEADKSIIWSALWNRYTEWASVFMDGSYAVTDDWKEGSKVKFLDPEHNGIYSIIEGHIPNELMRFKHVGSVSKGEEQAPDDETETWTGASEAYSITEGKNNNTLTIEIDVLDEHLEFMKDKLPKALEKVKLMAME